MLHSKWKQSTNQKQETCFQPKKSIIYQLYLSSTNSQEVHTPHIPSSVNCPENHSFKTPQQRFKGKRARRPEETKNRLKTTASISCQTSLAFQRDPKGNGCLSSSKSTRSLNLSLQHSKEILEHKIKTAYQKMQELTAVMDRRRQQKQIIISSKSLNLKIRGTSTAQPKQQLN